MSADDADGYLRHIGIIILDLLSAYGDDPDLLIGYNRGKPEFVRDGVYWDMALDEHLLSEKLFLGTISFLEATGYIENQIAEPGYPEFSSRMRATDKLANLFTENGLNWAIITTDPNAPVIIVKDENKKPVAWPDAEGFDPDEADANLRRINENLKSSLINLNVTDEQYLDIKQRLTSNSGDGEDDDDYREPFEFSNRSLRRIFSLGNFENGGRFYGGWWQGLPSEYRKFIEIDGAVTVEQDYSTNQARIMYAKVGVSPPIDSYIVEGWPEGIRPIAKKAFNQLINSKPRLANESQWRLFAPDIVPNPLPRNWHGYTKNIQIQIRREEFERRYGRPYDDLIRDLRDMHGPISEFFFSEAWGRIQRLDSDVAERVMVSLLDRDIPITVLPIHDSFIVRR
jgi:hypothetical protein